MIFALTSARTLNEMFSDDAPAIGDTCNRCHVARSLTGTCSLCE